MKHSYKKQILEHHLDTFGHVNNAKYLELYEEARWDMITEANLGLKEVMEEQIGPIILDLNITFKAELKNRDNITIESEFIDMKNKLVCTYGQKMIKEDGTVASEITLSIGVFDMKARKLIPPTEKWVKAFGGE